MDQNKREGLSNSDEESKRSLRIINKKKSLNSIQNVARNLRLKFGEIWMKNVKGP